MKIEPEVKLASDTVVKALAQTAPDVGVVACLNVAITVLIMTGLDQEKAIETLSLTLAKFKEVE